MPNPQGLEVQRLNHRRTISIHHQWVHRLHSYKIQEVVYRAQRVIAVDVTWAIAAYYQYLNLIFCQAHSRSFASLDLAGLIFTTKIIMRNKL